MTFSPKMEYFMHDFYECPELPAIYDSSKRRWQGSSQKVSWIILAESKQPSGCNVFFKDLFNPMSNEWFGIITLVNPV